ncbi:tRNA (adenosine(37)-N6)-threonylcarbamoyltransferase complex ATPase subunit type 1 TsaE [Microbacteriaceae bacterium]|nr:tRNA (adenosine(37)-N6)-threonylcarbamoyltransferase complex ATPase subunit type 1 TsaE [Candidatus Saccharibacteria bacterium]
MIIEVKSPEEMIIFGQKLGDILKGGEVIELVGDVGAGKTTFTKGVALGLSIDEAIQSPTFTINRMYPARDDLTLVHYDFYRLNDAGVMAAELDEVIHDPLMITIVEWGEVVAGVLPESRIRITIVPTAEQSRQVTLDAHDDEVLRRIVDIGGTR